jgi:hypothetical protein
MILGDSLWLALLDSWSVGDGEMQLPMFRESVDFKPA